MDEADRVHGILAATVEIAGLAVAMIVAAMITVVTGNSRHHHHQVAQEIHSSVRYRAPLVNIFYFLHKLSHFLMLFSILSVAGSQIADSLIRNAISGGGSRGGSSGGGGGGGGNFINSLRYGGLFNENNGHGQNDPNKPKVTVPGAGPGGMFNTNVFHTCK